MFSVAQIFFAAVGAFLLAIGIRGRRIDDHPLCAKCGFDLTGKPNDVVRCGECGAFLTNGKSIRIGHRRRRARWLAAGFTILLPPLLVTAVWVWSAATGKSWLRYMPTRLVLSRSVCNDPLARTPALAELAARYQSGKLPPDDMLAMITSGLDYQADPSRSWDTKWGDLLENAHKTGKLSADEWKQYVRRAWQGTLQLHVRPRVRLGDPMPFQVDQLPARCATNSDLRANLSFHIFWPEAPDHAVRSSWSDRKPLSRNWPLPDEHCEEFANLPATLRPGPHQPHLVGTVTVGRGTMSRDVDRVEVSALDLAGAFTMLPANEPSVEMVADPKLIDAIRRSLSIDAGYQCTPAFFCPPFVNLNRPPVAIAFDVIYGDQHLGSFSSSAGASISFGVGSVEHLPARGKKVDITLRSSAAEAARTVDLTRVWSGEIVFGNIVLRK